MENPNDESTPIVDLTDVPVFTFFRQKFLPAAGFADATVFLTTAEIRARIIEHIGTSLSYQEVHNWMIDCGYKYDTVSDDLKFVWLLKETDSVFED